MGQQRGAVGRPTAGGPPLNFGDGAAFRAKPWGEVLRAWGVLRLCAFAPVVRNAATILRVSRRVLGARLWGALLRATFYGQFVGGATHGEVAATARRLRAVGLRPMLAIPTEEDVGQEKDGEEWYEANRGAALECVGLAAASGPHPMMQLKVTALMSARLCETVSRLLASPAPQLTPEGLAAIMEGEAPSIPRLTPEQNRHLAAALRRLDDVAGRAAGRGVALLVDAETSDLNAALSLVTLTLMTRHNRAAPWVWNTYQAYLRDGRRRLEGDAAAARRYGARFGVKLVRGAYLEAERRRAGQRAGPDPLHPTLAATHQSYAECLEAALALAARDAGAVALMVATHNEASLLQAVRRMEELGIPRRDGGVCFAQLLGMGDHLSLALGAAGFAVYKSVPWGPAEAALPYLARRALENRGVLGGARRERLLLGRELRRRLLRLP